jgi:histidinol-phosphatase
MTPYQSEREFALALRRETRSIIMDGYRRVDVDLKADGTDVTEADRATERLIRARLRTAFPADGVLAEEYGGDADDARQGRCWVVDPIDGTTWFALGVPLFATLVALLEDGEPVLGLADFPALGESYFATRGSGAWWLPDGRAPERVRVRAPCALGAAFGSASGIHETDWAPGGAASAIDLAGLTTSCRRFRFCADALQHVLVARGQLDLALDQRMAPWDSAALVPIIEEAGGAVASIEGRRDGVVFSGSLLSGSHRDLLAEASTKLQRHRLL